MAENQVQSEKKMTSLNVSSETRDAIKDISTSLGLSQADTVARLVDGYHPNATSGVKAALDASAVLDEVVERVKRIIVGAAEAAAMEARAACEDADAAKKSATEQIQSIKSNCVEQVAAIKEKFELDTASLEIENDELHATVADYLSQLKKLDSENNQLLAESAAKDDRIESMRGAVDAAAKAQADLNVSLLAQRDLMAEVAALKDRLTLSFLSSNPGLRRVQASPGRAGLRPFYPASHYQPARRGRLAKYPLENSRCPAYWWNRVSTHGSQYRGLGWLKEIPP